MPDLHLLSPKGFRAAGVHAGIKSKQTNDVGLLICDQPASAAAVFTTNKVFAAPVKVGREHLAGGKLQAVVVNAGNANACTGRQGETDARQMCALAAHATHCQPSQVLPSSTGIIGHLLPMEKIAQGILAAAQSLGDSHLHALAFADAILTTDTKRKSAQTQFKLGKQTLTLAGVCKGSGMIGPRMAPAGAKHATLLAYLTTDAALPPRLLQKLFTPATNTSFNAVTIDDHTSTNDTACILASNLGPKLDSTAAQKKFAAALTEVCQSLAYQIAADGEGATKVFKVVVKNAKNDAAAQTIARAIATSPLVKCAIHGNDPNWGRIVSAAGLTPAPFDPDKATLTLQNTTVFRHGQPLPFNATQVSQSLNAPEVTAVLDCRQGKSTATLWTCDLSKDYVTINADYHT